MKVDDLLRQACWDAQQWTDSLIACLNKDDPEYEKQVAWSKELKRYRHRRWGKSQWEEFDETLQQVSLEEVERGQ